MKIKVEDSFDDSIHEFEISDELYKRAYLDGDKDALYEIAVFIDSKQEMSELPIVEMMEEAWDDGEGCELAGDWLDDYYSEDDSGRYDAWA